MPKTALDIIDNNIQKCHIEFMDLYNSLRTEAYELINDKYDRKMLIKDNDSKKILYEGMCNSLLDFISIPYQLFSKYKYYLTFLVSEPGKTKQYPHTMGGFRDVFKNIKNKPYHNWIFKFYLKFAIDNTIKLDNKTPDQIFGRIKTSNIELEKNIETNDHEKTSKKEYTKLNIGEINLDISKYRLYKMLNSNNDHSMGVRGSDEHGVAYAIIEIKKERNKNILIPRIITTKNIKPNEKKYNEELMNPITQIKIDDKIFELVEILDMYYEFIDEIHDDFHKLVKNIKKIQEYEYYWDKMIGVKCFGEDCLYKMKCKVNYIYEGPENDVDNAKHHYIKFDKPIKYDKGNYDNAIVNDEYILLTETQNNHKFCNITKFIFNCNTKYSLDIVESVPFMVHPFYTNIRIQIIKLKDDVKNVKIIEYSDGMKEMIIHVKNNYSVDRLDYREINIIDEIQFMDFMSYLEDRFKEYKNQTDIEDIINISNKYPNLFNQSSMENMISFISRNTKFIPFEYVNEVFAIYENYIKTHNEYIINMDYIAIKYIDTNINKIMLRLIDIFETNKVKFYHDNIIQLVNTQNIKNEFSVINNKYMFVLISRYLNWDKINHNIIHNFDFYYAFIETFILLKDLNLQVYRNSIISAIVAFYDQDLINRSYQYCREKEDRNICIKKISLIFDVLLEIGYIIDIKYMDDDILKLYNDKKTKYDSKNKLKNHKYNPLRKQK